jgi:hypothetical protein
MSKPTGSIMPASLDEVSRLDAKHGEDLHVYEEDC